MRIGMYQFHNGKDIRSNCAQMKQAVQQAAAQQVRLLAFQECALCGYPPLERPDAAHMDFAEADRCLEELKQLALAHGMYLAVGTIRKSRNGHLNSTVLLSPDGRAPRYYDKRALWGYDRVHFISGDHELVVEVDGIRVGFLICYEVRFPEYFRELFCKQADLCIISFCDVAAKESKERYEIIKGNLATRAAENVMTVASVNSISGFQAAPTAVFRTDGSIAASAPNETPHLLVYEYTKQPDSVNAAGRRYYSKKLLGMDTEMEA